MMLTFLAKIDLTRGILGQNYIGDVQLELSEAYLGQKRLYLLRGRYERPRTIEIQYNLVFTGRQGPGRSQCNCKGLGA